MTVFPVGYLPTKIGTAFLYSNYKQICIRSSVPLTFTWEGEGTSILKLSLDFTLIGVCKPFHLTADSALLVMGLRPDVRWVVRDGRKVHVLDADDISRSIAATNTINVENNIQINSLNSSKTTYFSHGRKF